MPAAVQPILEIEAMSKTFPGQRALSDVSLDVLPGEVHALVGENGSGKSTLIKCLSGYHQPDPGTTIKVAGEPLHHQLGPDPMRDAGLVFMHQDLGLVPTLSVMENLALGVGFERSAGWRIRWRAQHRRANRLLEATGHSISPTAMVAELSKAEQSLVALARVMGGSRAVKVAVFDEPTASLTPDEIPRLFKAIRNMTASGAGVIYVSHRLEEVLELSQRVTVLRDGVRVATMPTAGLTERELVEKIVGDETAEAIARVRRAAREHVPDASRALCVRNLSGPGVGPVSFDLHRGEVLGVAGLLGSGRTELARLLFGLAPRYTGEVELSGRPLAPRSPADAIRAGVALVPEDRHLEGAFLTLTVRENATLLQLKRYWIRLRLRKNREASDAADLVKRFNVKPAEPDRQLALLSGGNQQKVVLAKWMTQDPKVLILDEPMQGIDVGAKAEVAQLIRRSAASGTSVILIDSELDHLLDLSDRVVVLSRGRQMATLESEDVTRDRVLDRAFAVPQSQAEKEITHA